MSVFGVILVRIFPYSNWKRIQSECREMRTRITPNKDNFSRSERVPFFQRTERLHGLLSFSSLALLLLPGGFSLTNHFIISTFPWFSIIKISCSNEFNHISREFYSCWYQHKRQKYPGLLPGFYIQRKLPECILSTGIFSKSTMETPEQCVKSIQSYNKDIRMTSMASFWCLFC